MTATMIKLGQLPDRTPVKLSLALDPDLNSDLKDYAAIYAETYGEAASITALAPHMLRAFLDGDAGFKRARKALVAKS